MKTTTLQIIARDTNGNDIQRSITNANPDVSNYVLKTFAEKVNELTTNTYRGAVRLDKEDITNATNE